MTQGKKYMFSSVFSRPFFAFCGMRRATPLSGRVFTPFWFLCKRFSATGKPTKISERARAMGPQSIHSFLRQVLRRKLSGKEGVGPHLVTDDHRYEENDHREHDFKGQGA